MTLEELEYEATEFICKEVVKNTNVLLGKEKTAHLSTGLFLKLPIEIRFEQSPKPLEIATQNLPSLRDRMSAYVEMKETKAVHFVLFYDNPNHHSALLRCIKSQPVFWAFVYLHEMQHIIRKHTTTAYNTMMTRIAGDVSLPHQLINIAEDYAINYSIKDIFLASPLSSHWNPIENICLYKSTYHTDLLSDIDILKDLKSQLPTIEQLSEEFESVSFDNETSIQPTEKQTESSGSDKTATTSDDFDTSVSDISNSLQDLIRTNTKGTAAGQLFEALFDSIEVNTAWFKKIKSSFKKQVYYRTHDYMSIWSSLNNVYRKIYKAPKRLYIDEKIRIILSVDHSGSMATEDLQRLLYLVESEATRISHIHVLIHDTAVVKEFELASEFDITKSPDFTAALATRFTVGGTSHDAVFARIEEIVTEPEKTIYLSFSDNYSDIEQKISNYPVMKKLTNYWVSPVNNPVKAPGTNILMS